MDERHYYGIELRGPKDACNKHMAALFGKGPGRSVRWWNDDRPSGTDELLTYLLDLLVTAVEEERVATQDQHELLTELKDRLGLHLNDLETQLHNAYMTAARSDW